MVSEKLLENIKVTRLRSKLVYKLKFTGLAQRLFVSLKSEYTKRASAWGRDCFRWYKVQVFHVCGSNDLVPG